MKAAEAFLSGRPYRRRSYPTGAYFQLLEPYSYFSMEDIQAEDWEVEPLPKQIILTEEAVEKALIAAYEELLTERFLYGYMTASYASYPKIEVILKHLGFK